MFKIVFTPTPTLKRDAGNKERFVDSKPFEVRKQAELTLEVLQKRGMVNGIYKIVDAEHVLK